MQLSPQIPLPLEPPRADRLEELRESEATALLTVTHAERLAARMQRVLELRDGRLEPAAAT